MAIRTTKADVVVRLLGDVSGLTRSMKVAQAEALTMSQKMQLVGKRLKNIGSTMTMGVTLPIVAGFAAATKAAIAEEKEMAVLEQAMRKNVDATDAQVDAMERWITKTQNWSGVADGELRPAMGALLAVTKDSGRAQKLMGIALDIAAAKGKNVTIIAEALAKAQNGNIGILSRYGIATRDAAGEMMSFDEILQNAANTFGGTAAKAAETTSGKMAILKAKFADLGEEIGTVLIPFVEKAAGWIGKLATWFGSLSDGTKKFIVIAAGVVAALGPMLYIIGLIVSIANPVGAVVAAIAALIAILVVLYKRNETFRALVQAVWGGFKVVVSAVGAAIGWVLNKLAAVWSWLKSNQGSISAALRGAFWPITVAYSAVLRLISALQTAYNWAKSVANYLGGSSAGSRGGGPKAGGGGGFNPAYGGIATGPMSGYSQTLHGTELIVPMNGNPFDPVRSGQAVGGSTTVNVYLDGALIESHVTKRQNKRARRNARTWGYAPA